MPLPFRAEEEEAQNSSDSPAEKKTGSNRSTNIHPNQGPPSRSGQSSSSYTSKSSSSSLSRQLHHPTAAPTSGTNAPTSRSNSTRNCSTSHLEEERRLAYVAMTRARDFLFLSCCLTDGNGQHLVPSPFLDELPNNIIDRVEITNTSSGPAPTFQKATALGLY